MECLSSLKLIIIPYYKFRLLLSQKTVLYFCCEFFRINIRTVILQKFVCYFFNQVKCGPNNSTPRHGYCCASNIFDDIIVPFRKWRRNFFYHVSCITILFFFYYSRFSFHIYYFPTLTFP